MSDEDKANQESKESQEDRVQAPAKAPDDHNTEDKAAEAEASGAADGQSPDSPAGDAGEARREHGLADGPAKRAEVTPGDGEAAGQPRPEAPQGGAEAAQGSSQEAQVGIGLVEEEPPAEVVAPPDPAQVSLRLEQALTQLADLAREEGMKTLASEITSERLPALREGRVTAVVLGEFNHGKSTILNALLGDDVLPMGITPTTSVITHLKWGETPKAVVHFGGGDTKTVPIADLPEVVGADQTVDPSHVEVIYPAALLEDNLVLVDTPGVNDISRQRVEITYGYLPRADVIIYVLDANQVLKRSEIVFIRDRLLRANKDRLVFVLGKIDTLSAEERVEVESYAREKLTELVGAHELYPVSAKLAMQGKDPGFDAFRAQLLEYLKQSKAYILIDSGVSGGLRVAGMLNQNLAIKRRGYSLDKAELQRRVEAVRSRLDSARQAIYENIDLIDETTKGMKVTAKHNLRGFVDRFAQELPAEVDRASVKDVKRYLGDWIRDTYKEWLEREGGAIARELERLAEEVIETTNANLRQTMDDIQQELGIGADQIDLEVDSMTYDVGVYALGLGGLSIALLGGVLVGGLVMLAAPILAIVIKDKLEEKTRALAKEEGVKAVRAAGVGVEEELVKVIEDYGEKLKTFVESAGDRLYHQIDEALAQVSIDVGDEACDRDALDKGAAEAQEAVDRIVTALREVRDQLVEPDSVAG